MFFDRNVAFYASLKHFIFGLKGVIFMGNNTTDPKPTGTAEFQFILQAGKTASAKLYFSCIGIKHCTENQADLLNLRWRSVYDFKKNCFRSSFGMGT